MANLLAVDLFVAIFFGRKLENPHVCHGKSVGSTLERDLGEFEVCYEGNIHLPTARAFTDRFQVHNTHIGTAKKSTKSS